MVKFDEKTPHFCGLQGFQGYLFDYYDEVLKDIGEVMGIDIDKTSRCAVRIDQQIIYKFRTKTAAKEKKEVTYVYT